MRRTKSTKSAGFLEWGGDGDMGGFLGLAVAAAGDAVAAVFHPAGWAHRDSDSRYCLAPSPWPKPLSRWASAMRACQ